VRQRLLKVKHVNKVEIFGAQDEKLFVDVSHQRLAQLGLDFNQVLAQLGQQNAVESAGTINSPTDNLQVRVSGQFTSEEQLRALPIRSAGNSFRLGDIATVTRGTIDPPQLRVRHQGSEVLALGVSMTKGGDIIEMGDALKVAVQGHSR
jgi:multidrug efflux pump